FRVGEENIEDGDRNVSALHELAREKLSHFAEANDGERNRPGHVSSLTPRGQRPTPLNEPFTARGRREQGGLASCVSERVSSPSFVTPVRKPSRGASDGFRRRGSRFAHD